MSRLRRDTVKLMKVLYRLGTKIGEAWPPGSWVYCRQGHRWRVGVWYQVPIEHGYYPYTRSSGELSESEANARGIFRSGNAQKGPGDYYVDTVRK